VLAKGVYLSCDGVEGFLSDNYFDLLPRVRKKITFTPATPLREIRGRLRIVSLFDTFN
jgi:hypothetical protein